MINLTSPYLLMFVKCFVYLYLLALVWGAPYDETKRRSLREEIRNNSCVFPPANLSYPTKCSQWTLSTSGFEDLSNPGAVDYFLCIAMLDSTNRLCSLVKKNSFFRERVESALKDSVSTDLFANSDGGLCTEMQIDSSTKIEHAKYIYSQLKTPHCSAICVGVDEKQTALREPLCKSIQFAHQQILTATELQQNLNTKQASRPAVDMNEGQTKSESSQKDLSSPIQPNAVVGQSLTNTESSKKSNIPDSRPPQTNASSQKITGSITPANQSQVVPHQVAEQTPLGPVRTKSETADDKIVEQLPPSVAGADSSAKRDEGQLEARTSDIQQPQDGTANIQLQQEDHNDNEKLENIGGKDDQVETGDDDQNVDGPNSPDQQQDEDDDSVVGNKEEVQDSVAEKAPVGNIEKTSNVEALRLHDKNSQKDLIEGYGHGPFVEAEDSHFFTYFLSMSALFILGYLVYHNKRKIIAMAVEGKKSRNTARRRPNSASYHKLDSNLEEAMSSNFASTNSYVIY